jgi:hypothetical protein
MRRLSLAAGVIMAAASIPAFSARAAAQSVVNTPSYSENDAVSGFGPGGVSSVGQTFTAPTGATSLSSFTFYLANDFNFGGGDELFFQPYLMVWDVDHATGLNLLSSSPVTQGNATSVFAPYTFAAGVAVNPGDVFVAFLSTTGVQQSGNGFNEFAGSSDTYDGGQMVYNFSSNPSGLTDALNWGDGAGAQIGFDAEFTGAQSTVPEPSEFLLLATGLSGMIGVVRMRGRRM